MPAATLTIRDETATGQSVGETVIEFLTETITVRELIRSRVYQEVQDYNLKHPDYFKGLVQPTDAEQTLNGYRMKERRQIDWKKQFAKACDAFERNGFFILVGDKQVETLDEPILISPTQTVAFVKLTPLVGG
jgi:hypothetical protein